MKMQKGEIVAGRPDPYREPTHPGEILREDVLPAIREPVMTWPRSSASPASICIRYSPRRRR